MVIDGDVSEKAARVVTPITTRLGIVEMFAGWKKKDTFGGKTNNGMFLGL